MELRDIDVWFDFTSDTPGYWDGFWNYRDGLGGSESDPDALSPTLREYHRLLWSKELPCGAKMELADDPGGYLAWGGVGYSSDSITASFRYRRYRHMIDQVAQAVGDYHSFVEGYLRKLYTIGGTIIFPRRNGGMNQSRGTNEYVSDRWDLTMECIRRHYAGQESPLSAAVERNRDFFDLFVDFDGYVDFFHLQDCVDPSTGAVRFWLGDGEFAENPWPKNVAEYLGWIESQLEFVGARNARIQKALRESR